MKISTLHNAPFSFLLETENGNISINTKGENISVFLSEQNNDEEKIFHWPGEYEIEHNAIFLQEISAKYFLGKIFAEHIRVVFFTDEETKESTENTEDLSKKFGNTDVFIFQKGENGLTENQVKKLIEEVDPRALVATGNETIALFKKLALPIIAKEKLSFTKSNLPSEHTEYYSL